MPELPEVETIVRQLAAVIVGWRIQRVRLMRRDMVRASAGSLSRGLIGCVVSSVSRRGKRVVISLDQRLSLVFGLGMSGRLLLEHPSSPTAKHTHLRIGFERDPIELRFRDPRRFGGIWLVDGEERADVDRSGSVQSGPKPFPFGLEPLTMTADRFRSLCRRRRQIKALLLDQDAVAGLGNIYCDEALFRAGVHPRACVADLDRMRLDRLRRAIRRVLHEAIRHGGTTLMDYRTVDGGMGAFQSRHRVYGREDQPCRRCGTAIRRIVVAGRSTHFCPICQRQ